MLKSRPLIVLTLLISALLVGCDNEDCEDIVRGDYNEELDEIRQLCECNFTIQCDASLDQGANKGRMGVTILDANDLPLVTLSEDVDEDVLKHELAHAVDLCRNHSRSKAAQEIIGNLIASQHQNIPLLPPQTLNNLITYFEIITSEFLAYRKFDSDLDTSLEGIHETRFPNADDEDIFILQGLDAALSFMEALPAIPQQNLKNTLDDINMAPEDLTEGSQDYQALKRKLREIAEGWESQTEDCCKKIEDEIDFCFFCFWD